MSWSRAFAIARLYIVALSPSSAGKPRCSYVCEVCCLCD